MPFLAMLDIRHVLLSQIGKNRMYKQIPFILQRGLYYLYIPSYNIFIANHSDAPLAHWKAPDNVAINYCFSNYGTTSEEDDDRCR